jgi:hypothetical protein
MKKVLLLVFATFLLSHGPIRAEFWGFEGARSAFFGKVWETELSSFESAAYQRSVERLIAAFEAETGKSLVPGEHRKAGIKVYTNSGPGHQTPLALTRAVIEALVNRGFERKNLLIIDAREANLRDAGYLPPLAARVDFPTFEGVPVGWLDSGSFYDPKWFYDNPVPQEFTTAFGRELLRLDSIEEDPEARKSPLPATLLTEVDFWINLPMVTDHPAVGLNGALVNATLWNVGNRRRFFLSPANAPVAIAEIAAIPEIQDTWACTLMTLEAYQYIGGPGFNSFYTVSEPRLWLSADPVVLDALILARMNRMRQSHGFRSLGEWLPQLEYAAELNLGYGIAGQAQVKVVKAP